MGAYSTMKTALISALAAIDGTGGYSIDLSGADAISEERFSREAGTVLPRAYLTPGDPAIQYRSSTEFNDLGSFGAVALFDLVIVVAPADNSNGARVRAAAAAMEDVIAALGADQDLSSSGLSVEATLRIIQGAELGSFPYGVMYAVISVTFHEVF